MVIGVHGRDFTEETVHFVQQVFDELKKRTAQLCISEHFYKRLQKFKINAGHANTFKSGDDLRYLDFFLTLGGDGTLLEAVTYVGRTEVPILGINMGRLGFLATIAKNDITDAIDCLFHNNYTIETRSLLKLISNKYLFDGTNFALNDFTIQKKDTTSIILVHAYVNGEFLNSYWADGLIIATPTGSTGYSLSCGGPLILPESGNFVITPVSAHNLTVRPIVVPDNCEISFTVEGRTNNFLISLDSRFETVDNATDLKIVKEGFYAKLVRLRGDNYFKTIRQKLHWGKDIRN